jgi:hypothetical protein
MALLPLAPPTLKELRVVKQVKGCRVVFPTLLTWLVRGGVLVTRWVVLRLVLRVKPLIFIKVRQSVMTKRILMMVQPTMTTAAL